MMIEIGKDYLIRKEADNYHFFEPRSIVTVTEMLVNDGAYFCTGMCKLSGKVIEQVIKEEDLEEYPGEDYSRRAKQ